MMYFVKYKEVTVKGSIPRKDYHVDAGPEFFYQIEGDMLLKTMRDGRVVDVPIRAGQV
ncbi:MAG: 3-hydroxyanthranilate 3,4-dioxygenase, partial [Gammaproteobacteria bacterium]